MILTIMTRDMPQYIIIAIVLTFASSQAHLLVDNLTSSRRMIPVTVDDSVFRFWTMILSNIGNIFGEGLEDNDANALLKSSFLIAKLAFFVVSFTISQNQETFTRFIEFKEREYSRFPIDLRISPWICKFVLQVFYDLCS